jgi:predicted nucleotidyltransferase
MKEAEILIAQVSQWAIGQETVQAVALVGSWARGTARDDSDVDLVILTGQPEWYLANEQWIANFGEAEKITDEDWGAVQSKRVFYKSGLEVEFGITTNVWAETNPVDQGTEAVVCAGMRILYDKVGILQALIEAVNATDEHRLDKGQ